MNRNRLKGFLPLVVFFAVLNALLIAGRQTLEQWGADREVLIAGNTVIFVITLISFLVARRGLQNPNPNVFVRSVMGSIMIKMFILAIVAFVYISWKGKGLNKPALFGCMGLYLVYTFLEVMSLTKLLKRRAHG